MILTDFCDEKWLIPSRSILAIPNLLGKAAFPFSISLWQHKFWTILHDISNRSNQNILSFYFIAFILLFGVVTTYSQDSLSFEEQYRQEYLKRIQKSHIKGFYIPQNLPDAMRILDEIVDEEGKQKFASREDSVAVNHVFFSFGRWINMNWGMEQGSRLTVALNKLGVSYPDDMTRLIMYAWHRHLNRVPLQAEELVDKVVQERLTREEKARNLARDKP